jgi:hypothetical protein
MTAALALATETLTLERTLSDLADHAYGLTRAERDQRFKALFVLQTQFSRGIE